MTVLAVLSCNPYWMPMGVFYAVIVAFIILFGGFAVFMWREKGGDERDVLIRHVASRFAYLTSALVMAIGIIYQAFVQHAADPWLVAAFSVIVLAKAVGYAYSKGRY